MLFKKSKRNYKILFVVIGLLGFCGMCFGILTYHKHIAVFETKTPLVSVVMPVYNRPELVGRAIESILNQTMQDFEFVIVDDGSDEATKSVLKTYAAKDKRIRLIHNPKNRGISYSRQRGIDFAKGTYIATMDSDDWSVPERLEKSIAFMRDYPEIDAMTGSILGIPEEEFIPQYEKSDTLYTVGNLTGFYDIELMFSNIFPNVSSLFKRSFVVEKKIRYNESLISAEDYDFWRQMVLFGGKLGSIQDPLVYVRHHMSNSSTYYEKMFENSLEIHRKMLSLFFNPRPEDIQLGYSTIEKCDILSRILESNRQNPKIPHSYIENRFSALCPTNFKEAIYLVHPFWESFLVQTDDQKWVRYANGSTARIELDKDKLTVLWDAWPKEIFYLQKDNQYIYQPEGEKIELEHPSWHDSIIIPEKPQKTCLFTSIQSCCDIKKIAADKIILEWDNPDWTPEVFQKNKNGIWQFVEQPEIKK